MSGNWITAIGGVFILIGTAVTIFGVFKTNNESDAKTREIATLARSNAELSAELRDYATGGASYFYLHVEDFGSENASAMIRHVGAHPIRDVEMIVFDVTNQMEGIGRGLATEYELDPATQNTFRIDSVYPHGHRKIARFPFVVGPTESFYSYFVHVYAGNGLWRQQIQLENVDGTWKQAYVVDRESAEGREYLVSFFDDGFPSEANGRLKRGLVEQPGAE